MVRTKTLVLYHNGHGQLWVPNVTTKVDAADPLCVRAPEPGEPRLTARWHAECWYGPLPKPLDLSRTRFCSLPFTPNS